MSLKKIKPQESAFNYNPRTNELILISDMTFALNTNTMSFEVDQNPHGEGNYAEISNLETNADCSEIKFEVNYRKKDTTFQLTSNYEHDKIIYKVLSNITDLGYLKENNDKDKIEIIFTKGSFNKMYLYKYNENKLIDSFTLLAENNTLFLVKQNPWRKITLGSITINNHQIICSSNENEEFVFVLQIQDFVEQILISLLKPIMS